MAAEKSGLLQVGTIETQLESEYLHNGNGHAELAEEAMVQLSPVQIQQEYYENLGDCDWVK